MAELHWLSAAELASAYRGQGPDPVDLVAALLARIDRFEPELNVFIHLDREDVLRQAEAAAGELAAGRDRGPLHGVPVAVKDMVDVAGQPTTNNCRLSLDTIAGEDAEVVRRLRAAGAIIFGKVNTYEMGIGGPGFDLPFGSPRNPWNRDYHVGGSSSGSGAGVAAGFFPLSVGTDGGGSIRHPASRCGIVGMKPTNGTLPHRGMVSGASSQSEGGPMARSVVDAALMLDVMRAEPGAPVAVRDFGEDLKGMRIGYVRHFHEEDLIAHAEVRTALDRAAAAFGDLGAEIREIRLSNLNEFIAVNRVILFSELWANQETVLRPRLSELGALTRQRVLAGAMFGAPEYIRARQRRLEMIEEVNAAFEEVDVLLTASSFDPTVRLNDREGLVYTYSRQAWLPFNVTGHPAISLMSGLSSNGLPMSLQLVGPLNFEDHLLKAAAVYETTSGWSPMHPQLPEE